MRRDLSLVGDLLTTFKSSRVQMDRVQNNEQKKIKRGYSEVAKKEKTKVPNFYDKYLIKLDQERLSDFNSRDIMYFFRDKAQEVGVKYIIANEKIDMRNFKLCLQRGYKVEEVLLMIEFLFLSEQNYLDKKTIHPGTLLTGWCNKIYQDSNLWLNDEYTNEKKVSKPKFEDTKEWTEKKPENTTKAEIGEWDF